ncbi:MAG: hypothetical protein ACK471_17375, partial [Dolichospermum sp.]
FTVANNSVTNTPMFQAAKSDSKQASVITNQQVKQFKVIFQQRVIKLIYHKPIKVKIEETFHGTSLQWYWGIDKALPDVMRYKNPTPNPLPASEEGA